MTTTSRLELATTTIIAIMLCCSAANAADSGKWVLGPDGQRYYQPATTDIQLPVRRQTAMKSPQQSDGAQVTLVGHQSAPGASQTRRPVQPLQQLSETRQVGDRIEAAAYVRPLGQQSAEQEKVEAAETADEKPNLNAATGGVWAEQPASEATSRLADVDSNAPTLTIPEFSELPLAEQPIDDAAIVAGSELLAEAAEPSASRIISTWLPESEATPTQWTPTQVESTTAVPEAPPLIMAPTLPQTTAWQGVEAADLAPRLPADSVIPSSPAPRVIQPMQPGVIQPMQPAIVQAPAAGPVVVRQAPTCAPPAYAAVPAVAAQGVRPGMTVRRGLLGQPVIHLPGQPVRNFLRFVTP